MAKEPFLINPYTKKNKCKRIANPLAESLLIVGANPTRKGVKNVAKRKAKRRKRRSPWNKGKTLTHWGAVSAHKRRVNPYRSKSRSRRRRRNPVGLAGALSPAATFKLVPFMATGAVSAIATNTAPGMVGVISPLAKYGVQAAVAVIGGLLVGKTVGRQHGTIWTVMSGAVIISDLLKTYLLGGIIPGISGMSAFPEAPAPAYESVGAYPEEVDLGGVGMEESYPYGSGEIGY